MTFVRTRLALDALAPGQVLLVKLCGPEPVARVPGTARALGHLVLAEQVQADGVTWLFIRRA